MTEQEAFRTQADRAYTAADRWVKSGRDARALFGVLVFGMSTPAEATALVDLLEDAVVVFKHADNEGKDNG